MTKNALICLKILRIKKWVKCESSTTKWKPQKVDAFFDCTVYCTINLNKSLLSVNLSGGEEGGHKPMPTLTVSHITLQQAISTWITFLFSSSHWLISYLNFHSVAHVSRDGVAAVYSGEEGGAGLWGGLYVSFWTSQVELAGNCRDKGRFFKRDKNPNPPVDTDVDLVVCQTSLVDFQFKWTLYSLYTLWVLDKSNVAQKLNFPHSLCGILWTYFVLWKKKKIREQMA